jgi:hypothetical protein
MGLLVVDSEDEGDGDLLCLGSGAWQSFSLCPLFLHWLQWMGLDAGLPLFLSLEGVLAFAWSFRFQSHFVVFPIRAELLSPMPSMERAPWAMRHFSSSLNIVATSPTVRSSFDCMRIELAELKGQLMMRILVISSLVISTPMAHRECEVEMIVLMKIWTGCKWLGFVLHLSEI